MLYLIKQIAAKSLYSKKILDAKIILPSEIFPLPEVDHSLIEHRKKEYARRKKISEENKKKLVESSQILQDNKKAINEIIDTFEKTDSDENLTGITEVSGKQGFFLSRKTFDKMSEISKQVLKKHGFVGGNIDVAKSVITIEKSNAVIARDLYQNMHQGTIMVKLGSSLLPDHSILPDIIDPTPDDPLIPGICPPVIIDDSTDKETITVPNGTGVKQEFLVAELILVEQKLLRYEMGEIAHIENVLKGEKRERNFRTTRTREDSLLEETEKTEEEENDLTTTDRYELQTESQNIINENASQQAGVTISYDGPTVDATSNYNYAGDNSSQQSRQLSSNFARETTLKAASRIESRKLQRRFTRTVEEIEELNKHKFDNAIAGSDNISGIYRWVDKIYEAQMVNYGKKTMLEFIVPEPAAFIRYAEAQMPPGETPTLEKPDHPGFCLSDGKTFQPLRVEDIDPESYLYWIAKYNVQGISPPPSRIIIASTSIVNKGGEGEMRDITGKLPPYTVTDPQGNVTSYEERERITILGVSEKGVSIPEGYIPYRANINLKGEPRETLDPAYTTSPYVAVQVQDQEVAELAKVTGGPGDIDSWGYVYLASMPTEWIPITITSRDFFHYEVIVNVFCSLSKEKYQQWQLDTYMAIMNSYNDKKSRYEASIETAKIRSGFNTIKGRNPLLNREIEKRELKKGCISLLTGQRFNDFDAVNNNVAPFGFPEMDFIEAKAEGDYIKFFEQAFEWENMIYLFYPYFWSNKKEWIMLSRLDDTDPLYVRFLQAGSARVQVPVRPMFEPAMSSYLAGAQIWDSETGEFILDDKIDPNLLSIAEEFKNQTGNNSIEGKGTLKVQKNSNNIIGIGTEFSENDINRRINIKGKTYIVKKFVSKTDIILETPFMDENDVDVMYSLGGILVGQPWEIKLPTNLVKLDPNISIE